jgi:hypothetical protein
LLAIKNKHRLRLLKKRVIARIFGARRDEVVAG